MNKQTLDYLHHDVTCNGYLAYTDATQPKPAVLVSHDWTGQNEFARQKAEKLAELGYVGFALDMYGNGKNGQNNEEKSALINPFFQNRSFLQERILAAYHTVRELEFVDSNRIAAIGFCFGGLCVLDLARIGTDIKGVVSFHGLFTRPENMAIKPISSKILALHGYDDPMAKPESVNAFADEMTQAKADWQIHMYGHTMHSFTNPLANDPAFGTVYNATAEQRSWQSMKNFLAEIFQ